MKRSISLGLQSLLVFLLIGAAIAYIYAPNYVMKNVLGFQTEKTAEKRRFRGTRVAPVITALVTEQRNNSVIEAIGDGRAVRFVTLFPMSDGEIKQLSVKAGQKISKGDVILKLSTRKAELAVRIAEASVLEEERKVKRAYKLQSQKVASKATVDDAITALNKAKLALDQAKETLNDRILRAPFAGVVGIPKVEAGDRVTTSTEIVTLDDRTALTVEFDVPEFFFSQLKAGQKFQATTPGYSNKVFTGKINQIDSRIEATSRSVKVRAEIPNSEDLLRPGMSFSVQIIIPGKYYPTIPELALQWGAGESFIWKIIENKARKVKVRMVKRINSLILIEGNVSKDDLVVIEGVQRLRDGIKIQLHKSKQETQRLSSADS